ncbi:MAG: RNA-directed DNA polymerase [Bacteroidales bacterium]|nr:RNA-directed DNA polymerase [Candidatus Scybalousia scybalohippi]
MSKSNHKRNQAYRQVRDANNLMAGGRRCMQGVTWKQSTQSWYLDRLHRVQETQKKLDNMERMSEGFTVFGIIERGKPREIKAVHINERTVQNTVTKEVLLPRIRPKLVYDNYASLQGRGIHKAFERVKAFLQQEYRRCGSNEFYVAVGDLHAYFDSIDHDVVYQQNKRLFMNDPKALYLTMDFVDAVGDKGFGLGSQVFQTLAVFHPNEIDHYIKEQLKIKGYGRYMDDFFMIHSDKRYLQQCIDEVEKKYRDIGIELSLHKTKICKVGCGFKFLKAKISVTSTGKIVMRPDHSSLVRERRKLRKFKEKLDAGVMEYKEIEQQYKSWRGYMAYFDSYKSIKSIDALYDELFIKDWRTQEHGRVRKERGYWKCRKFGDKQNPSERRHGVELADEWN